VRAAVDGLDEADLTRNPCGANPVGWLLWHLTRVQDHHVSQLLGAEQLWTSGDWAASFGSHPIRKTPATATPATTRRRASPHGGERSSTTTRRSGAHPRYLQELSDTDLDEIVDRSFDPLSLVAPVW